MATKKKKDLWADDKLQFARLIAEIEAAGGFTTELCRDLCDSMDVTLPELTEIIDRAQTVFETSVANLPKR